MSFWKTLSKPFFTLAPLANVTDAAFRRVIAKYGKPDVLYTEFVSADGLIKGNREVLLKDLIFTDAERPIVAQVFTRNVKTMEQAAALAQSLGFDGVDINMGCPDRAVESQGAGAKLILNPELAQELIAAAKKGAPKLPVSLKTRLGYNEDSLEKWLPALLEAEPAAIAVHARTRKEMSKVPARFERVKRAVELRNQLRSKTLIIGNGDVQDIAEAKIKAEETGADGIMIGRGIFGKPWLFATPESALEKVLGSPVQGSRPQSGQTIFSPTSRLRIMVEHAKLFEELFTCPSKPSAKKEAGKSFSIMKKHFKAYCQGFSDARELRMRLMTAENATEVEQIVNKFLSR